MAESNKTNRQRAADRFFLRVAQAGEANYRCPFTLPLFPLVLILDADGTLAADAQHLLEAPPAKGGTEAVKNHGETET